MTSPKAAERDRCECGLKLYVLGTWPDEQHCGAHNPNAHGSDVIACRDRTIVRLQSALSARDAELREARDALRRLALAANKVPIVRCEGEPDYGRICIGCDAGGSNNCSEDCWAYRLEVASGGAEAVLSTDAATTREQEK